MKKTLNAIVILLLVVSVFFAIHWRKSVDLKSLSVEELNELQAKIENELDQRDGNLPYERWFSSNAGSYVPSPDSVLGRPVTTEKAVEYNKEKLFTRTVLFESDEEFKKIL